jgi:hypothetical protein
MNETGLMGGGGLWIFGLILLFMIFGGGGIGGYGGNNNAIQNDINRGFDNQNLQAQTRDILSAVTNGTAQSVAATNQTFHDSLMANQGLYNELARDISNVQLAQSQALANQNECCCSTKMLIQQTAADNALQMSQMEARINAKMDANKIEALQAQINKLQLQQATSGMLRFPTSWSYDAGQFPPVFAAGV